MENNLEILLRNKWKEILKISKRAQESFELKTAILKKIDKSMNKYLKTDDLTNLKLKDINKVDVLINEYHILKEKYKDVR